MHCKYCRYNSNKITNKNYPRYRYKNSLVHIILNNESCTRLQLYLLLYIVLSHPFLVQLDMNLHLYIYTTYYLYSIIDGIAGASRYNMKPIENSIILYHIVIQYLYDLFIYDVDYYYI